MTDPGQAYPPAAPPYQPVQYPPAQYPPPPVPPYPPVQYPSAPAPQYAPAYATPAPQQYAPQPVPAHPPYQQPGLTCRYCGATPALKATARGHRGMVVIMQFRSAPGPFCRDCGTALVRKLASDTMWQGWWGYFSFLATPVVLLIDFVLFVRLSGLARPVRSPGSPAPLDKGRPVFLRPGILGLLLPLFLLGYLAVAIISNG